MEKNRPNILLVIIMLIGLVMFIISFKSDIENKKNTENYEETNGLFVEAILKEKTDFDKMDPNYQPMYYLKYLYEVDGVIYAYITDYLTSIIPEENSIRIVKYNTENPSEAYLEGFNVASIVQLVGLSFFLIPIGMMTQKEFFRNIIIFLWGSIVIFYGILGELYKDIVGIIVLSIPGIMVVACLGYFFSMISKKIKSK